VVAVVVAVEQEVGQEMEQEVAVGMDTVEIPRMIDRDQARDVDLSTNSITILQFNLSSTPTPRRNHATQDVLGAMLEMDRLVLAHNH
jgi:hypothetical protein